MDKRIFTTGEVAKVCDVTVVTVNKWFDTGLLQGYRMPGSNRRRIPYKNLIGFLQENNMPTDRLHEFKHRTVLVVDDDPDMLDTVATALRDEFPKIKIETSLDGFEACVKAGSIRPDLVVLDIFMPGMNGFEVCKALKADPNTSKCKILGITGLPEEGTPAQLLECGADDCLVKPLELPIFMKKVRKLLGVKVYM